MGINRWSDIEERKRNEADAKAGDEVPKDNKGDASTRLQASEEPAENEEKRQVVEKLEKLERESWANPTSIYRVPGRTTDDPAQRGEGAKRRTAPRRLVRGDNLSAGSRPRPAL